jgi:hypothetical protein
MVLEARTLAIHPLVGLATYWVKFSRVLYYITIARGRVWQTSFRLRDASKQLTQGRSRHFKRQAHIYLEAGHARRDQVWHRIPNLRLTAR